jgi:hypothetical protein
MAGSAFLKQLRTGQIGAAHRAAALAMFTRLATDSFPVVAVSRLQFRTATRFVEQHALGFARRRCFAPCDHPRGDHPRAGALNWRGWNDRP